MKVLRLIGIGTGDPDHVTLAGMAAIASSDCVLIPRKGPGKDALADLRRRIVRRATPTPRIVEFGLPERNRGLPYTLSVERWHDAVAEAWTAALPPSAGTVGLLIWGDPSLYDSSLRIAARLEPRPETEVIPGITALQALTAAHRMPLNEINAPVLITTGRQLRDNGWPDAVRRIAVMLDGACSFRQLDPAGVSIWWGAYLGLPQQILRAGALAETGAEIAALRDRARAEHGWIMDTYLLHRDRPD